MAALSVNAIVFAGLTVGAFTAAGTAHEFANDGRTYLEMRTGGTASTVSIVPQKTIKGLTLSNQSYVLGTAATVKAGPFSPDIFNDSAGSVHATVAGTAALTLAAFRLDAV